MPVPRLKDGCGDGSPKHRAQRLLSPDVLVPDLSLAVLWSSFFMFDLPVPVFCSSSFIPGFALGFDGLDDWLDDGSLIGEFWLSFLSFWLIAVSLGDMR